MHVSFRHDLRRFNRGLSDFARRQLPFATALALTRTAEDVKTNTLKRMARVFDRPTPFTMRGVAVRRASKRRPAAAVFLKDRQADYLEHQETGGTRTPSGRALVIPQAARVNRYGNLPRGAVARAAARPDTFEGTVNGTPGIWQRKRGGKVRLLVSYADRARYAPRFGFQDGARKTAVARFGERFAEAFAEALRTARR